MSKKLTKKLDDLKEGESLVYVSEEKNGGFFIHIGDNTASNTWAVTKPELLELQKTLTKWTSKKENKGALWG
tara:strand:+ start:225 stop:440 length:216 start_codon:yes stop_codon:yes gene_type:complete